MKDFKNIHIVGIGGAGTSSLAGILQANGTIISGSDQTDSPALKQLSKKGIKIATGHHVGNIPDKTEAVIYSLAIGKANSELVSARRKNIPTFSYPEAVGELTKLHNTIAICGTHGKTTITAMLAHILIEANFDPTVIVGSHVASLPGGNFRASQGQKQGGVLVLEACEYKEAFLHYAPHMIVLNTLDADHLDYYKTFDRYLQAFQKFVSLLPRDGYLFANIDDEEIHSIVQYLQKNQFPLANIFTYARGYEQSDFYLKDHTVHHNDTALGKLTLQVPGEHNRINALAAFSVAHTLGVSAKTILASLQKYQGAARRFEYKGTFGKTKIYDDYGHHPAEIRATLQAAKERFPKARICLIFQPHQYSRTRALLSEFATAFGRADTVIIPNIYEARDSRADKAAIDIHRLVAVIRRHHSDVHAGGGIEKTIKTVKAIASRYDMILTMGAGDVWKVAHGLR